MKITNQMPVFRRGWRILLGLENVKDTSIIFENKDLEMSKDDVKDLKNELLSFTPDESSGVIDLAYFDSMLTDLGLNIKNTVYKSNIY